MREKEKLLVTSNFSFPHDVFHNYISVVRQNAALCSNGLMFDESVVGGERCPIPLAMTIISPGQEFAHAGDQTTDHLFSSSTLHVTN